MSKYHKILGLKRGASQAEIKSAFRRLSKVYHPDKNNAPDAEDAFIRLNHAYKFLTGRGPTFRTSKSGGRKRSSTTSYTEKKAYYHKKKKEAASFARKKSKEANRNAAKMLKRILDIFKVMSYPVIALNLLFVIDYVILPLNEVEEDVVYVGASEESLATFEIHFENYYFATPWDEVEPFLDAKKATLCKTYIFGFKKALINTTEEPSTFYGETIYTIKHAYYVRRALCPIIVVILLLIYFKIEYDDVKTWFYVFIYFASMLELVTWMGNYN